MIPLVAVGRGFSILRRVITLRPVKQAKAQQEGFGNGTRPSFAASGISKKAGELDDGMARGRGADFDGLERADDLAEPHGVRPMRRLRSAGHEAAPPTRAVWLSIHFPLSPKCGGELASASMLASLARFGWQVFSIHIAYAAPSVETIESFREKFGLSGVSFLTTASESLAEKGLLAFFLATFLPFLPHRYARLMWPRLRRRFRETISRIREESPQAPLLVICDGLQACALLRAEGLDPGTTYVYRAHNVESGLWRSFGRFRAPLVRVLISYQAWRVGRLERWVLRRFDQIHAISSDDAAELRRMCAEPAKVHFAPVTMEGPIGEFALPEARRVARASAVGGGDDLRLLFLGYFAWPPNRDGLTWFLDGVWNALLDARPNVSLTIAGDRGDDLADRYREWANLVFTGYLTDEELRDAFLSHDLLVVPIFSGAGVRIKVLQAALHGLASIGTDLGMSGSTLEAEKEFLRVDGNPKSWIRCLSEVRISDCEALGREAYERISGTFARDAVEKTLRDRLEEAFRR